MNSPRVRRRHITTWTADGVVEVVRIERPIATRIVEAYREILAAGRGEAPRYHDMLERVFPRSEYPDAWRYSSNGGPPGCAMTFGRALRMLGGSTSGMGGGRTVYVPSRSLV